MGTATRHRNPHQLRHLPAVPVPTYILVMTSPPDPAPKPPATPAPVWAGEGHMRGCLFQAGILVLVNLLIWGFIFLLALRQSAVPIRDVLPWWPF